MPPSIDFVSPAIGAPGDTVTLHGTGFSTVDDVLISGTHAPFTIVSDSVITLTVPLVMVTAGPFATVVDGADVTSIFFQLGTPGEWIQEPDAWRGGERSAAATYNITDPYLTTDPEPPAAQGRAVSAGGYGAGHRITDDAPNAGYVRRRGFTLEGVSVEAVKTDIESGQWATPPALPTGALGWVFEGNAHILGPAKIIWHIAGMARALEESDHSATLATSDAFGAEVEIRRVPAGTYTLARDSGDSSVWDIAWTDGNWPADTDVPLIVSYPVATADSMTAADLDDGPDLPHPNTYLADGSNEIIDETLINYSDRDADGNFVYLVTTSPNTTDAALTPPEGAGTGFFSGDFPLVKYAEASGLTYTGAYYFGKLEMQYRPARYRAMFPYVPPTPKTFDNVNAVRPEVKLTPGLYADAP